MQRERERGKGLEVGEIFDFGVESWERIQNLEGLEGFPSLESF